MAIDRINTTALLDGGVTTDDIADDAVTSAKLDTNIAIDGNLLVGSTSAVGNANANDLELTNSGGSGVVGMTFNVNSGSANTGNLYWRSNASNNAIQISGDPITNYLAFSTSGAEAMRIISSGDVGIGNTDPQNIVGAHGGGLVLRSAAARAESTTLFGIRDSSGNLSLQHLHNGTTVFNTGTTGAKTEIVRIDGNGLKFNGDTAAANALDDYEEGTLVPSLSCTNSNAGITYTTQVGKYVKIGNKVHVVLYIELSSKGSASGNVRISGAGFPFTPSSTSGFVQTGHVALNGTASGQQFAGQNDIWGQLAPGDATLRIYADSDGDVVQLDTGDIGNVTSFRVNMSYFV